jgi:hypothetical protein
MPFPLEKQHLHGQGKPLAKNKYFSSENLNNINRIASGTFKVYLQLIEGFLSIKTPD